jgi:hypothetical protein
MNECENFCITKTTVELHNSTPTINNSGEYQVISGMDQDFEWNLGNVVNGATPERVYLNGPIANHSRWASGPVPPNGSTMKFVFSGNKTTWRREPRDMQVSSDNSANPAIVILPSLLANNLHIIRLTGLPANAAFTMVVTTEYEFTPTRALFQLLKPLIVSAPFDNRREMMIERELDKPTDENTSAYNRLVESMIRMPGKFRN